MLCSPLLALLGCPVDPAPGRRTPVSDTGAALEAPSEDSSATDLVQTASQTYTSSGPDCDLQLPGQIAAEVLAYPTGPDFDFDADGMLLSSDGQMLIGWDGAGGAQPYLPVEEPRGIQVTHSGAVLVSSSARGTLDLYDIHTGLIRPLLGGMIAPSGIEVGAGDVVYVAEAGQGRVFSFQPSENPLVTVAELGRPTQIALDPSESVLYVADLADAVLWAIDRIAEGWDPPRRVVDLPAPLAAVEVDSCGHVYGVGISGELWRIDPDTADIVLLADLALSGFDGQGPAAARWGSDLGPWRRDVLYVTDGSRLFAAPVGIAGRDQPVDDVP